MSQVQLGKMETAEDCYALQKCTVCGGTDFSVFHHATDNTTTVTCMARNPDKNFEYCHTTIIEIEP